MKKLIPFFTLLLLTFSSCKFAQHLNDFMDLKAPEDKKLLTVFSDLDSSDYIIVDLGDGFVWGRSKLSLNKLLNNEKFAVWYNSRVNGEWKKVGVYVPDCDLGLCDGDRAFYLDKNDVMYIGWNSPFDKVRLRANRFNDKEVFDYYFPESYDYNALVTLNYSDICKDGKFNSWLANLGNTVSVGNSSYYYTPTGFVDEKVDSNNYYNQKISKAISVNKWRVFVNLGWITTSLISGITIHANRYENDTNTYYVSLDDSYERFNVDWNYLAGDSGFLNWYNSLSKSGSGKLGLSYSKDSDWVGIYEGSNSSIELGGSPELYIIWGSEVSSVTVHAGKESTKIYFSSGNARIRLTWNMLERNNSFMTWYKDLTDTSSKVYTKGLSSSKNGSEADLCQYCNNNSWIEITSDNNDLYVVYENKYAKNDYLGCGITVSSSLYLVPGETLQSRYWVEENSAYYVDSISFSTSDSSVAVVDGHGLITARGTGSCQINFTVTDYSGTEHSESDTVYVSSNPKFELLNNFRETDSGWYSVSLDYYSASDDGKIQAVIYQSRLYRSDNYGRSWKKVTITSSDSYSNYNSVKVSHSGKTFAVSAGRKIYVSEDYGKSFYNELTIDEKDFSSVYVLGISDDAETLVYNYYSYDLKLYLLNIYRKNSESFGYGINPDNFSMSASGQCLAYSYGSDIFYSDDYGKNINTFASANSYKFFMTSDGLTVFYRNGSQFYKAGVKTAAVEIINIPSFIDSDSWSVSPDGSGIAYYDYSEGKVYYSTNGGDTWNSISQNITYPSGIFVTNNCSEIFLTYKTGLYRWRR